MPAQTTKPGSPAHFSLKVTRGRPAEFKLWQNSVSPMFNIAPLSVAARASFSMTTAGYFLPGLAITKTTSSACTFKRSRALIAKSGIANILVQVYLKGSYHLNVGTAQMSVTAGDIAVIDLARESVIKAKPYTNIALTLQRELLAPMIADMDKLHGLILRSGTACNVVLLSHMQTLQAQAARLKTAEQSALAHGTAGLVAACAGPLLSTHEVDAAPEPAVTLQALRQAIDARLDDPTLTPESLASLFELSRSAMYRMFEPLGGVRAYIQQRRLMHAYQLLINPSHFGQPINAISKRFGFSDNTSFSRAFKSLYKMTPSDVRIAAKSGELSGKDPSSGEASYEMLNRWLLGLDANGNIGGADR